MIRKSPNASIQGMQTTNKPVEDCMLCPTCRGTFFKVERVQRYAKLQNVILGQVPPAVSEEFIILVCERCDTKVEPQIVTGPSSVSRKQYDSFLDEIEDFEHPLKRRINELTDKINRLESALNQLK